MLVIIIIFSVFILIIFSLLITFFLFFSSSSSSSSIGSVILNEQILTNIFENSEEIISYDTLQVLLKDALGSNLGIITLDEQYKVLNFNTLMRFIQEDKTDQLKYLPETTDCDDFARILQGEVLKSSALYEGKNSDGAAAAFGTLYGEISLEGDPPIPHAMNIAIVKISDTLKLILIEPQTDKIYDPNNNSNYWVVVI